MRRSLLSASVLAILSLLVVPSSAGIAKGAMRLEDVTTLVFTKNEMTASRRSSAVPQLLCVSGSCQYAPNSAMCRNIGFDGRDVAWKCEAELPKGVKFGKVQVSCEGFASRDDEYVLKGSCGLEYALEGKPRHAVEDKEDLSFMERHTKSAARGYSKFSWLNPMTWSLTSLVPFFGAPVNAAKEYARHGYDSASHAARDTYHHAKHDLHHQSAMFPSMGDLVSSMFSMIVKSLALMVFLYVLYKIMCPTRSSYSAPQPNAGPAPRRGMMRSILGMLPFGGAAMSVFDAFTGPSSADSGYAPPPSYQQSVNNNHGFEKTRTTSQTTYQQQPQPQPQAQQQSNWGFLHGALGGAAAGYLLGGRRGRAAQEAQTREEMRRAAAAAPPAFNPAAASYSTRDDARYPTAAASSYTPEVPEVKTTETTTAFATTRRR